MEFLSEFFSGVNLTQLVVIPVVGFLGGLLARFLKQKSDELIQNTKSNALRELMALSQSVAISMFQQVIKPTWKAYKENPSAANREAYRAALATAKKRAIEILRGHVQKLPKVVGQYLEDKIEDVFESSIPGAKEQGKPLPLQAAGS